MKYLTWGVVIAGSAIAARQYVLENFPRKEKDRGITTRYESFIDEKINRPDYRLKIDTRPS